MGREAPQWLIPQPSNRTMRSVKPGIALKFFLAILLAAAAAAAAMAIATRLSFQSGFLGYLNQVDAQRLDSLAARLADEYRASGDWSFLRDDYARLRALALPAPAIPRLALLDAAGHPVLGNSELAAEGAVKPVVVNGDTVGWVARAPLRRLSSAAEVSFQQEQLRSAWVTAALALVLPAGFALAPGRAFVPPVKRAADATHRLAAGGYPTAGPAGASPSRWRSGATRSSSAMATACCRCSATCSRTRRATPMPAAACA